MLSHIHRLPAKNSVQTWGHGSLGEICFPWDSRFPCLDLADVTKYYEDMKNLNFKFWEDFELWSQIEGFQAG